MKPVKLIVPMVAILLSALLLMCVATGLSGLRRKNAAQEQRETMEFLLPGSKTFTAEDENDDTIRAVWRGETGRVIETVVNGYAGEILLLVGVDDAGRVTGVTVRDLIETRGLGGEALHNMDFLRQFLGTNGNAEVGVNVDALAGATVTSRAIARGVNAAAGYVTGVDTSSGATEWGG